LSCAVLFVQPVGAAVCTNNIAVPDGNPLGACQVGAAFPLEVRTCPDVPYAEALVPKATLPVVFTVTAVVPPV
jgi:hypothetical protein